MHWEVEQKFRLDDAAALAELRLMGVSFSAPSGQVDFYFNHPARDFAETDEAFRLRSVGEQNFLTYKGPKVDPLTKTRRELELPVGNGAGVAGQVAEMLVALGFRPAGKVCKTRRTATIDWEQQRIEVVLDEVEGLGSFLELEISADDLAVAKAKAALKSLADRLNLIGAERRSYLEMILGSRS